MSLICRRALLSLIGALSMMCRAAGAQDAHSESPGGRRRLQPLPAIGSSPETGLQLGATVLGVYEPPPSQHARPTADACQCRRRTLDRPQHLALARVAGLAALSHALPRHWRPLNQRHGHPIRVAQSGSGIHGATASPRGLVWHGRPSLDAAIHSEWRRGARAGRAATARRFGRWTHRGGKSWCVA